MTAGPGSAADRSARWDEAAPHVVAFGADGLPAVRGTCAALALAAGLSRERADELTLAVHEVAANSIRHGGGRGTFSLWTEADRVVSQVQDAGHFRDLRAGETEPDLDREDGRGLWLARQLCDLVQIRSNAGGTTIRLHVYR
ncbi:MAG TPA: ATP-binding protein [Frankiaceae bacterium]|jgi:anti-sigma regulatory factor (Ser/Thr protein kinase)